MKHRPPERAIESEVTTRVGRLFLRHPALHGFAVQNGAGLVHQYPGVPLDGALVVSDVGVYPALNEAAHDRLCDEIATVLHDLITARPEAAEVLLEGRTFVRVLH